METHINDIKINYTTQLQTNPSIYNLEKFLESGKFITEKKSSLINVTNQLNGHTYCISPEVKDKSNITEYIRNFSNVNRKDSNSDMDDFMYYLEECRKTGAVLNYSELQYFNLPVEKNKKSKQEDEDVVNDNQIEKIEVRKSGFDLDFDIYQKEDKRVISDTHYYSLALSISNLIVKTLDLNNVDASCMIENFNTKKAALKFHVAILRKPNIVSTEKDNTQCFKDSFRIRFPGIKISKEHKKYIINEILEQDILSLTFTGIQLINNVNKTLDTGSATHPLMFLGSAKRGSQIAHEFYKLYYVVCQPSAGMINLRQLNDLDPINQDEAPIKIKSEVDKRKTILKQPIYKYRYNLCYELSINYENPRGLIKKREFNPKPELETEIRTISERKQEGLINKLEFEEIKNNLTDLVVRNYDAEYIRQILDILDESRVRDYESWRKIIYILATENPEYKTLAIWFSYRCPESWARGGLAQLEQNWEWALNHSQDVDPVNRVTIATLYAWAKQDSPEKYEALQEFNVFTKLQQKIHERMGALNETDLAELLQIMWGKKFKCDVDPYSTAKNASRRWYEFVFPEDDKGRITGYVYKWRLESGYPDSLDRYISKKLPDYIKKVLLWLNAKLEEGVSDEKQEQYYQATKKNVAKLITDLGKVPMINKILDRCDKEFRERGFEESLDKYTDFIGVGNGVLQLYPKTELIARYHEMAITRSTMVDYMPYDSSNPYVQELEREIRRLFADEEDAYIKTMCYLASSLDGRKRRPLFYIWLGEGQNGKSFLLEMHISTLREVMKGGYGAKINMDFFTQDRKNKGGPDSEKMMLKYARYAYCSESERGDTLKMAKIKEFTSETLSGNDKHKTQDMFRADCHFTAATNNDPKIIGNDHGTWRRIWAYRFKMMFVANPNPNNKYEYKENFKFSEIVTKDPNYKRAYLSILVKFYELYRDKYNCDLTNISSPSLERDTIEYRCEQDTITRFIREQIRHVGKNKRVKDPTTGEFEKTADIPVTDIVKRYIEWYRAKIGVNSEDLVPKEIIKDLVKIKELKNYMEKRTADWYLREHVLMQLGEEYEEPTEEVKEVKEAVQEYPDDFDFDDNIPDAKKEVTIEDDDDFLND